MKFRTIVAVFIISLLALFCYCHEISQENRIKKLEKLHQKTIEKKQKKHSQN